MITIEINGKRIEAEAGEMLIAAADRAGVYIPRFCYHEKLSIAANCRMCLVEVGQVVVAGGDESAPTPRENLRLTPKPLPACATPVAENMVVFTDSNLARDAQRGTLEFLLINHPLDCPVCDQGGECPLQDQAMDYGDDDSRYLERKRSVPNPNIGPLIATEMTRCIHCTRCVRFGAEIAGVMELGLPGRGEDVYIDTFLNGTVDSEVSGNMIDLCPVGALTSKPYRFAARVWELQSHRGVSPHDCVGANLVVQTLRNRVERVLPLANPRVNECWLADRDRYSYEAVNSDRRLTAPMIRRNGEWRPASWETALQFARDGVRAATRGGDDLAALAGHTATLEEYYLLQKLARALGCNHIDHRVQQRDFRGDANAPLFPACELPIERLTSVRAALLVGANIRKEQPLLALRLRAATSAGARISAVNPLAYQQNFALAHSINAAQQTAMHLAEIAAHLAHLANTPLPDEIAAWRNPHGDDGGGGNDNVDGGKSNGNVNNDSVADNADNDIARARAMAVDLHAAGDGAAVILGALAQQDDDFAALLGIAQWICQTAGAHLAQLPPGNGAAAWLAGCVPHRLPGGESAQVGLDAAAMFARPRRAYLLLATDPELDCVDGAAAMRALRAAQFVVQITAYQNETSMEYADVLLPMAAFAETAGTFINCEGRAQRAEAAVLPRGESRPAWKILRVLGNFFDLPDFDYLTLDQVRAAFAAEARIDTLDKTLDAALDNSVDAAVDAAAEPAKANMQPPTPSPTLPPPRARATAGIWRLLDMPMYRGDQIVRHAPALQRTADNPHPTARFNRATLAKLQLADGARVHLKNGAGDAHLRAQADERVPDDCVYVPAGHINTARLGAGAQVQVEAAQ